MPRNSALSWLSAAICGGLLTWVLSQHFGHSGNTGAFAESRAPVAVESTDRVVPLPPEYDQRITVLTAENEALRTELLAKSRENTPGRKPSASMVVEEFRKREVIAAKQRDTENLLAAGYSLDRIEYLRRRADELATQFRQDQADQMYRGVWPRDPERDLELATALGVDPTFALKYEIGDAEYERYLRAMKRPTSVVVGEVAKGTVARSLGIMPGDEIVSYNNKRVFNSIQLRQISAPRPTDTPGALVPITVRREGQLMQMSAPKGYLGVVDPPPPIPTQLPDELMRMIAN
jgi:hypothetical protein